MDDTLGKQAYISGDQAGFLDYASYPFIRQFRIADIKWFDDQDWPYLHSWLQVFLNSDRFAAIMEKYKPWRKQDRDRFKRLVYSFAIDLDRQKLHLNHLYGHSIHDCLWDQA